jgi:ribosomal protein S27E
VREAAGRALPQYVQEEFEAYLKCGRFEHGLLRVRCEDCRAEKLVAFSCKRHGFCPSCGARRMTDSAALLADQLLPARPIRQWVLSLPLAYSTLLYGIALAMKVTAWRHLASLSLARAIESDMPHSTERPGRENARQQRQQHRGQHPGRGRQRHVTEPHAVRAQHRHPRRHEHG